MKVRTELHSLELAYSEGQSDPNAGYFEGGVKDPLFLGELKVWVDDEQVFNFETDSFETSGRYQIHIGGSQRALYEFGKYLVTLSLYETTNVNYHDHLDGFTELTNKRPCEIIAHLPEGCA